MPRSLVMSQILDHVKAEPLLESVDDWPRSIKRQKRFAMTRFMVQNKIADIDLDNAAMSKVKEAIIGAGCCDEVGMTFPYECRIYI
jgi:hypothetical protein